MPAAETRQTAFARLRRQLDRRLACPARPEAVLRLDVPGIDEPLGGGLPCGALTELVFAAPSSGGQLVLLQLLHAARRTHRFMALVDGADSFDPQTIEPPALLGHLLWVRCHDAAGAVQAADLLARDTNFALLALDLRGCAVRDLRRTCATAWYRLQRVLEPTGTILAILTPHRLVPAAQARLIFQRPLPLPSMAMEQADLVEQLAPELDRLRRAAGWDETATGDAPEVFGAETAAIAPAAAAALSHFPGEAPEPYWIAEQAGWLAAEDADAVAAAG